MREENTTGRIRSGVTLLLVVAAAGLLLVACSGSDPASGRSGTTRPASTMATTSVPPTTESTDPLDVAFARAGYRTPVPDELRIAVHTFCTASTADIAANLNEAMRAPLRIGFAAVCPARLADLDAARPGG